MIYFIVYLIIGYILSFPFRWFMEKNDKELRIFTHADVIIATFFWPIILIIFSITSLFFLIRYIGKTNELHNAIYNKITNIKKKEDQDVNCD